MLSVDNQSGTMNNDVTTNSCTSDIGTELWALAFHLYHVYRVLHYSSQDAFRELCLRTQCELHCTDCKQATQPAHLVKTMWYKEMCIRYADMCNALETKHHSDVIEAEELISDMYPNGCSVSSFSDTVQTCLAMLSFSVAADRVERYVQVQSDEIANKRIHQLSKDELQHSIVHELIIPSFVPQRWWAQQTLAHSSSSSSSETSTFNLAHNIRACKVHRVGVKVDPPTIVIEYEQHNTSENSISNDNKSNTNIDENDEDKLSELKEQYAKERQVEKSEKTYRHRRIVLCNYNSNTNNTSGNANTEAKQQHSAFTSTHSSHKNAQEEVYAPLPFQFTATTSSTVLARRLAASHDALLSESQFQKLVVKLQQLMRNESKLTNSHTDNVNNNSSNISKEKDNSHLLTGMLDDVIDNNTISSNNLNYGSNNYMMQNETKQQETIADNSNEYAVNSIIHTTTSAAHGATSANITATNAVKDTNVEVQKADLGLLYRDPERAMHNVDLNSADDITLREFKEAMDEKFKRHVLKPGDAGYVYDKRVNIAPPTEKSEWDDDDDDDDAF